MPDCVLNLGMARICLDCVYFLPEIGFLLCFTVFLTILFLFWWVCQSRENSALLEVTDNPSVTRFSCPVESVILLFSGWICRRKGYPSWQHQRRGLHPLLIALCFARRYRGRRQRILWRKAHSPLHFYFSGSSKKAREPSITRYYPARSSGRAGAAYGAVHRARGSYNGFLMKFVLARRMLWWSREMALKTIGPTNRKVVLRAKFWATRWVLTIVYLFIWTALPTVNPGTVIFIQSLGPSWGFMAASMLLTNKLFYVCNLWVLPFQACWIQTMSGNLR